MARQGAISLEEMIKKKLATVRRWKTTSLGKKHSKWAFQFSVMTYNILSQTALENHRYLYKYCSGSFLQEGYRVSRILTEILNTESDIICLQEVEQNIYDHSIKSFFYFKGFESIYKRRTAGKTDGCAILWRKEKFDLVYEKAVEFKDRRNKLLNRDNVGLIAVLKPNHPNSKNSRLHVATTHLLFNPKRGDVKLCQLRYLFAILEKMALKEVNNEERIYHPTILCGDFNIQPRSPLYQFIETGSIDVKNTLSGDLSGQSEGKNRGPRMNPEQLSLQKLGINKYSRFEDHSSDMAMKFSKTLNKFAVELDDPCIVAAMGSSKDPRSLQTLRAIKQAQMASEMSSEPKISNNNENATVTVEASNTTANPVTPLEVDLTDDETRFTHDFKFVPVYKFNRYSEKDLPITSVTINEFNTVDHIFYNVRKKVNSEVYTEGQLRLLRSYSLMRGDEMKDLGGLPNALLGSDHLALIANFGMSFHR